MELLRFGLVHYCDPTFKIGPRIFRINIGLNIANITLNNWSLVLDPGPLRILMIIDAATLKVIYIFLEHFLLDLIGAVFESLFQIPIAFFKVWGKVSVLNVKHLPLELNVGL